MAIDIKAVNHIVKAYADEVRTRMPVDKAVLFGSHAKGSATEQSDVDIYFFLRSFNGKRRVDVLQELLGLTHRYKGVYFEPITFPTEEIERGNPFVNEILSTGIEI
ncbi:MAG: hypothetical protein AWM53_01875 [Candidatus Dichloromethanomonas elyunquensis]|nr:MAG: hypothetical protein AWM53_01875 [Candidatus Dichloromethanomonas elyunquensis]